MNRITLRGQFPTFGRIARGIARVVRTTLRIAVPALLILAVAHGVAIIIQGRRVESRLREIKARGEVVSLSELGKPKVPDAENAAIVYRRALKALLVSPDGYSYLVDFLKPGKRAADPKLWDRAGQIVSVNGEALGLVEQAVARPRCQFPIDWEASFATPVPEFLHLRSLSRLLAARAIVNARGGRMEEAVQDIELSLRMSESLKDARGLTFIGQLIRMALVRQAVAALRDVMSYGEISEDQAVRLDRLLGGIRMGPGFVKAMQEERALGLWMFKRIGRNPGDLVRLSAGETAGTRPGILSKTLRYAWRPVFYGDELVYLKRMDERIALSRHPYRETASEDERMAQSPDIPKWAILSNILTPLFGKARMRADDADAELAGSRIALALQAYKGRYGSYPATLDELGRELPEDPFSGKAFVYRREGKGFVLYSIGGNLQDDKAEPVEFVRPRPGPPPPPGAESVPAPVPGPNVSVAQSEGPYTVPSIPEPHYGDDPKYGDIVWRMGE